MPKGVTQVSGGSLPPAEGAAGLAQDSLDEEAGLVGGAGVGTAAEGAAPAVSYDVSVMPTNVVEHRQRVVAPAAEPPSPSLEAAETKTDVDGFPGDTVPEVTSSMRFRGTLGRGGDEPPLPASPFASSSCGSGNVGGGTKMGSTKELFAGSSGHAAGNSTRTMIKKASNTFSQHKSHHNGRHRHRHSPVIPARGKLTEEDEAMLSASEADYDAFDDHSKRVHKKLLSPNFRFFRWYTTYMLLVLLPFVFYMPIRIAFFPREGGAWSAVDLLWDILFAVDVVIRLNTGFVNEKNGSVVYDRKAIFWHYAKGWLIVDLLAAFPFTFLPGLGPDDVEGNHEAAYLVKLPKMFRVYTLMTMVQENHRLHEGAFLVVRTLLLVIVTAQLFGCGWYMLATLLYPECEDLYFEPLPEDELIFANGLAYTTSDYIDNECPWIYRNHYAALSLGRKYLGSVYWALTTLTTVGYGDLSARTTAEQIYSMTVQIVGVSWYGYIAGTWATILNGFDRKEKEQRSKMREVVAFSKAVGLPPDIAKKVRQHFRFTMHDNWITYNEQELVSGMPSELRADVITHVHMNTISHIPWLEGKSKAFKADVAIMLRLRVFTNGDVLYRRASQPDEMFFIHSGSVMLKYKSHRVGFLRHGQMAGLIGLVSSKKHKITAVAHKDGQCYRLSRGDFKKLTETYPKEMEELAHSAKCLAQSIALSHAEAKSELMSTGILSSPLSQPQAVTGEEAVGSDRWTELQIDSVGHGSDSSPRPPLPATFSQTQPPRAPHQHQQQQQRQQQRQQPSAFRSGQPRTPGSEAEALSPLAASNANSISGSSAAIPTSLTVGSMPGPAGGSGEVGTTAVVEDAVGREVSRRMSIVKNRLGAVMELLEGFPDAASNAGDALED